MVKVATFIWSLLVAVALLIVVYECVQPNYPVGTVQYSGHTGVAFAAPAINDEAKNRSCTLHFVMIVAPAHLTRFKCFGASAVTRFCINDQAINCAWSPARAEDVVVLDLSHYLRTGSNDVQVDLHLKDPWVTFDLKPDLTEPVVMTVLFLAGLVATLGCWRGARIFPLLYVTWAEIIVVVFGTLLRICYALNTPFYIRSNDVTYGHILYIETILRTWKLPVSMHQTQEFFQPPAYYFLCAVISQLPSAFGVCRNSLIELWQAISCVFSVAILICCLFLARLLFERKHDVRRLLFLAFAAVFPTFVYCASLISNDVLLALLSVMWVILQLQFWRRVSLWGWLLITILLGVALLVKTNAAPLIIVSFLLLGLTKQVGWKIKLVLSGMGSGILLLIAGWFQIPRIFASKRAVDVVLNNMSILPPSLHIDESFGKLLTFNPFAMFDVPFNPAITFNARREFFWEFLFWSSFFGENSWFAGEPQRFGARVIVGCSLLLLPVIAFGFIRSVRRKRSPAVPLSVVTVVVCATHLIFVLNSPYTCSQHFRYSPVLAIPLTYFCIEGLVALPKWLKIAAYVVFGVLIASCAYFLSTYYYF